MVLGIAVISFPKLRKLLSYGVPRPQRVRRGSITETPSLPGQGVCLFFLFIVSLFFFMFTSVFPSCGYTSIKPPHPQLCLSSHQFLKSFCLLASNSSLFVLITMGSIVD